MHMKPIPVKATDDGCLERLPYASLMATVLCFLGVVLFTIMMIWGFNASIEQSQRFLHRDKWPWIDKVQVFFIAIAVLMFLFGVFFVIVGFTATGATREVMYKDPSARRGGRCVCALALGLNYILIGFWLVVLAFSSALVFTYHIFDSLCSSVDTYSDGACVDLSALRLLFGYNQRDAESLRVCGGDLQQFCALSSTALTWYWVGWVGAVLVLFGLIQYVATHASNYSHIGNASKYVELRECATDGLSLPVPPFSKVPPAPPPPVYREERYDGEPYRTRDRYAAHDIPRNRRNSVDERDRYSMGTSDSSTRLADKHSDSVSQYAYGRRSKPRQY